MRRMIELLDEQYEVTVFDRLNAHLVQVEDNEPRSAVLRSSGANDYMVQISDKSTPLKMAINGETAYIRAFGKTFTLRIIDPVEQAEHEGGGYVGSARAPMPGTVVEITVNIGDHVIKGQSMMIIESMKILTVISAPRDGVVAQIHFEPGQTFDKNATLITLADIKEK